MEAEERRIINRAAKYYLVAKRWKEESFPVYAKLGVAGEKFWKKQENLSRRLNRLGNNKKDYRELFAEAVR